MSLKYDLKDVPFSRFGSYLAVSRLGGEQQEKEGRMPGLWLRSLHEEGQNEAFRLEPIIKGKAVAFQEEGRADELRLRTQGGLVRLCFTEGDRLRVRVEGTGLRLTMCPGGFNCAVPLQNGRWLLNNAQVFREYTVLPLRGRLRVDAPWKVAKCAHVVVDILPDKDGVGESVLHESRGTVLLPNSYPDYEAARSTVKRDFEGFFQTCPFCPPRMQNAARLAAYISWSAVVKAQGRLKRPTMLMSKNWMNNLWSWDHCFNAMALAKGRPDLAWDQFMVVFDHQTSQGQIPDLLNDSGALYNFVKPPVHGWAYRYMMRINSFFCQTERLLEVYNKLSALSRWWLGVRDPEGEGLPRYYHGNDSGWDNGTVFDVGLPVEGSDLAALLVKQTELLADLAKQLGKKAEAEVWSRQSEKILKAMLEKLWTGDRFVSRHVTSGKFSKKSKSIIPCVPIVLGKRLPAKVRKDLVARIKENLTEWGVATENPKSELYQDDGYWRGPIWAPTTMLLVDGLREAGEKALAHSIAEKFCELCVKSGFAENFDALTGAPLRDKAYTWTAAVFFLLRV